VALLLIPLAPALAFVVLLLVGRRLHRASAWVAIGAMGIAIAGSLVVWRALLAGETLAWRFVWAMGDHAPLVLGLQADPLTAVMLSVVSLIGTLILIYSVGYMAEEARFSRFFAYMSLFCAAMLGLVLADGFVLLFLCWELVGLGSYLLISFWFEKPEAALAGKKAFITTRIGDTGLLLGILALYWTTGTLHFEALPEVAATVSPLLLTAITLGIFAGAVGKSAQLPLHVWLPDAMEGPTPVSALIHAATMVAAGVYLVARTFPLFAAAPQTLAVVGIVGTATAFFAATIACVMTDIKRVLAYSTISQLGFMMAALGVGSSVASIFHLTTHAWFKALLFLGAGSVIHALHTQELLAMGGLRRTMPLTCLTMLVGTLAISGIPPFSGFWSKDEILVTAFALHHPLIGSALVVTSVLTAFYMMRLFTLTFLGTPRSAAHPHESPRVMTGPLVLLAIGAAGVGLVGSPLMHHGLQSWLSSAHAPQNTPAVSWGLAGLTTVGALGALLVAGARYTTLTPRLSPALWRWWQPVYAMVAHKYAVDELYEEALVRPLRAMTQWLYQVDQRVIDRLVDHSGLASLRLSRWKERFDRYVVDGLVNGLAVAIRWCGRTGRLVQSGFVQHYLLIALTGALCMALYVLWT